MLVTVFYIATVIYCLSKLSKSRINSHVSSTHYNSDALDTLMVILLAPFLAVMDIVFSIIYFFKKSK
jgi:hypothetical protein